MAGIDRSSILIQGPALMTYKSSTFWSKGDVTIKPVVKTMKIPGAGVGDIDERPTDRRIEVSFEPVGAFSSGLAAILWPHLALLPGQSLFGSTDYPLVVHGRDGNKVTVHNANLAAMPKIRIGADKTIVAPVTFTGLIAKSTDASNAAAYWTWASASYPGDTGLSLSEIIQLPGAAAWGASSPWSAFKTADGWEIDFAMQTQDVTVDGLGTVDILMTGLTVTAKATPLGITVANAIAKLPVSGALGTSTANGDDLVISTAAGGPQVTLNAARLTDVPMVWGPATKRIGACTWLATRTWTTGTPDALASVAAQGA